MVNKLKILAQISRTTEERYLNFLVDREFEAIRNLFQELSAPQAKPMVERYPEPQNPSPQPRYEPPNPNSQSLGTPPMPRQRREMLDGPTPEEWDAINGPEEEPQPEPENIAGKAMRFIRGG